MFITQVCLFFDVFFILLPNEKKKRCSKFSNPKRLYAHEQNAFLFISYACALVYCVCALIKNLKYKTKICYISISSSKYIFYTFNARNNNWHTFFLCVIMQNRRFTNLYSMWMLLLVLLLRLTFVGN